MIQRDYTEYDEVVREYMEAIEAELHDSGKMKDVDRLSLDILASNLQKWRSADAEVRNMGILLPSDRGNLSKNPAIDVANSALRQALSIMQEYGLTALSRKKLKRGEAEVADDSPLAGFLKGEQ